MPLRYLAKFLVDLGEPLGSQAGDNVWDTAKNSSNFNLRCDEEGHIYFKELLYETIKFAFKDKIFKECYIEGYLQMKKLDKETRYRLQYQRVRDISLYF